MQNDGEGSNAFLGSRADVKPSRGYRNPLVSGNKKLTLVLSFHNQQTTKPDVVHVNTVRQIATRVVITKAHAALESISLDDHPCRNSLAGGDYKLQRFGV